MSFSRYSKIVRAVRKVIWHKEVEIVTTRLLSTNTNLYSSTVEIDERVNDPELNKESSIISKSLTPDSNVIQESKTSDNSKTASSALSTVESCNTKVNTVDIISKFSNTSAFSRPTDFLYDESVSLPSPLDTCTEDVSYIAPYLKPTFNFAAYVDKSPMIQEFVKLGVKLYKIEKNEEAMKFLLGLDFEKDIKPYIMFLHDCGLPADELGAFITTNPLIFKEDLDDLKMRIKYLKVHLFTEDMIVRIISRNPKWLSFDIRNIDGRLGYFQTEFHLSGNQVRQLTVKRPTLITTSMMFVKTNTFAIREEMGFNPHEIKVLILDKPSLWTRSKSSIVERFDYAHNAMKLPHSLITKQPEILLCRLSRLKQRHEFLVTLNRAQYDPEKPLYVAPKSLVTGTDVDFCRTIANVAVETYNMFLKSL